MGKIKERYEPDPKSVDESVGEPETEKESEEPKKKKSKK